MLAAEKGWYQDNSSSFDFVIGNRLDSSNLDLRTGIKGYIKGTSGNNIDFYITKSDPNNPDSTDILYLEYGSYPFISFTVECSAQFNLDSHLLNEADLSANTGMSQIITDFDLSEQNSENTTTAVRIFKELQVIDAVATPTTSGLMTAGDKIKLDNIDVKSVSFSEKEVSTAIPTAHQVTVTKSDGTEENFQFASSESPIVEYLTATIEGDELVLTTTTGHVSNTRYLTAKVQDNILYFKEGD